jgi:hypothetical protein
MGVVCTARLWIIIHKKITIEINHRIDSNAVSDTVPLAGAHNAGWEVRALVWAQGAALSLGNPRSLSIVAITRATTSRACFGVSHSDAATRSSLAPSSSDLPMTRPGEGVIDERDRTARHRAYIGRSIVRARRLPDNYSRPSSSATRRVVHDEPRTTASTSSWRPPPAGPRSCCAPWGRPTMGIS